MPEELFAGRARVIVIDDDAAWVKAIARRLGNRFIVTAFQDPFDGLVAIGANVPDAVVLDTKMQGVDGFHWLARLKELPKTRGIKAIVCSGHGELKKAIDAGAAAFILKPDVAALNATLEELLGIEPVPPPSR